MVLHHIFFTELLVVGTGSRLCMVPADVKKFLSRNKINLEVQDTVSAHWIMLFNVALFLALL